MKFLALGLLGAGALLGCGSVATGPPPTGPSPNQAPAAAAPEPAAPAATPTASLQRYRCDQNFDFTGRFMDDSAVIDAGSRGNDVLLRDAGGVTPQQTVYSNPRVRAEFGLGAGGREAILRYLAPQLVANCMKD
jgi:hypothetical protein